MKILLHQINYFQLDQRTHATFRKGNLTVTNLVPDSTTPALKTRYLRPINQLFCEYFLTHFPQVRYNLTPTPTALTYRAQPVND